MFEYTVNAILDTPTWRDAAGLAQHSPFPPSHDDLKKEQQYRSWLRAASKHLRILEAVRGVAEANENSAFPAQFDPLQLPFHPLHCAASQGMTRAGKLLLQRCSGNGNNQVRGCFVLEQREVWVHVGGVFLFFSISGPIHPQFTSSLETCVVVHTDPAGCVRDQEKQRFLSAAAAEALIRERRETTVKTFVPFEGISLQTSPSVLNVHSVMTGYCTLPGFFRWFQSRQSNPSRRAPHETHRRPIVRS